MFTGIIEGTGKLIGKRSAGGGMVFEIEAGFELQYPKEGESIACNGVCLTAYNIAGRRFCADVSPETLSRTGLGGVAVGSNLNLERALKVTDRLGGHIVSGHVDSIGRVTRLEKIGEFTIISFSLPEEHSRYIVEKGSIAIDGISLTVNSCSSGQFAVSIIPHTLAATTLGEVRVGTGVNIEVDIIGKYVENLLLAKKNDGKGTRSSIDAGFLAEHGFLR